MEDPKNNVVEFISRDDYEAQFGSAVTNLSTLPGSLPKEVNRKRVVTSFLDAFELLGGTQALVQFAQASDENYATFLRLYGRLAPPVTPAELEPPKKAIIHVLPRTKLDE